MPLEAKTPIKLFVPRGAGERLSAHIVYRGPLEAPVAAGADVAKLRVFRGDILALEAPLRTKEAVETGSLTQRALDAALELAGDWVRSLFAKR